MRYVISLVILAVFIMLACVASADSGITPICIQSRSIGGGDLNKYTLGVAGGIGVNNIGLLIRTYGKVTYINTDADKQYFYIDDGCGRMDGTRRSDNSIVLGIRVSYGGLASDVIPINPPPLNSYVGVTGISSTVMIGNLVQPNVRTRRQSDILPF